MFGIARRRLERTLTARRKSIDDPELHQRVIDVIDQAFAAAEPGRVRDDDDGDGYLYRSAKWSYRNDDDTLAHKSTNPDATVVYEITLDPGDGHDRLLDRPWLVAGAWEQKAATVTWMPGLGFTDPGTFLDWFVALTAPAAREQGEHLT
jgi:hypothetical protein